MPQTDLRVFSENIHFSRNHPAVNEEITVFAEIRYWATGTDLLAENVPINVYVTYPGTPSIKIGSTLIDKMSVGSPDFGSRYVFATWKNRAESIYLVEVEIDPSYVEENRLNNAATRAIIVGQLQSQQGAISGQVTDSWGSGIGNVILEVFETDGTSLGSTVTDPAGFYLVENVPVGEMRVRIETPNGYQPDAETKTAIGCRLDSECRRFSVDPASSAACRFHAARIEPARSHHYGGDRSHGGDGYLHRFRHGRGGRRSHSDLHTRLGQHFYSRHHERVRAPPPIRQVTPRAVALTSRFATRSRRHWFARRTSA